jgi:membrane fusion protein, heavy metal efflux system
VPLSSIEYEGDLATIFVQLDPNTYEKKYIKVRRLTGEAAIVESGLNGNETIAISQVFSLKALSKFEEFGEE